MLIRSLVWDKNFFFVHLAFAQILIQAVLATAFDMRRHMRRNQISSFGKTDESI